ncbi:SNF2-related protein [Aspergillus oryzae]|uniref:SNF2-related protein n=1 Tax=Aspergillus oryzae TaxID=5062 RepID=A0A1S9DZS8_ASPOZ|nr:SNF2-related protein [Aspergillus oryzae]
MGKKTTKVGAQTASTADTSALPRRTSSRLARSSVSDARKSDATVTDKERGLHNLTTLRSLRGNKLAAVEVAIPLKKQSPSRSTSSSDLIEDISGDGINAYSTPESSVAVTPAELDMTKPRKRVSASARARELRSSIMSINVQKGSKRDFATIAADNPPTESSEAALAQALQLQEYQESSPKRRKARNGVSFALEDSTDNDSVLTGLRSNEGKDTGVKTRKRCPARKTRNSVRGMVSDSESSTNLEDESWDEQEYISESDSMSSVGIDPVSQSIMDSAGSRAGARTRAQASMASLPTEPLVRRPGMSYRALRERKKLERQHPYIMKMWDELRNNPPIIPVAAEQPPGISRNLKSFQLEGLNWMTRQEGSQYKGGLLGDEMGMGKTIQAVSLLMSDYPVGQPSLVVVPPVALMQWQSEIKEYTNGQLKVLVYHNSNSKVKSLSEKDLLTYDVIMISYSGLESIHRKEWKGWNRGDGIVKADSIIHSIHYHRLILDEAHSIKQRTTSVALTERNNPEARTEALSKLRLITDRIMLRRIKRDHTASMELPPKRVVLHNEFFGEIERDFSRSIMTNSTRQFDTYVSRGVMLNNYANIFGLIMQMRQVANHPDLILKKHAQSGQNVLVCSICDEPAEEAIRSRCHHEFCRRCAKDYVQSFNTGTVIDCPRCHIPLSIDFEQPDIEQEEEHIKKNSIINRIRMENWTSSTKIEMLVYELYKLRSKKQTHKSIVFSQFTSMLQLVEWRLRRAGFNTVMLDGTMTPAQRQKSIDFFMNNVDVEVFLVSLKAGGVALNLTEASRVFIVDPWWNPAAEWQSADRCHRIGQRRPCVITRLCIEDSVESRIVLLQEKKANLINGTINKDQGEALEKLTPEDMQFLFRGS